MGIFKLALIGGAGYYAIKKLNEKNKNSNQNGQQGPQSQSRETSEGFLNGRPQQPEQKERYYDYEPNYQQEKKGPVASERALPAPAYAEGGEQRRAWNEKGEYQRNY
ncbi:hypothetical protein DV736_g3641, partial [Chaetothyriales sp. CBS 134916]